MFMSYYFDFFFFFSSRRRHTRSDRDWSSDVCSSDLRPGAFDTSTLVTTAVSAAIPAFVAAIVLILVFAVKLGWFPALGNGTDFLSNEIGRASCRERV